MCLLFLEIINIQYLPGYDHPLLKVGRGRSRAGTFSRAKESSNRLPLLALGPRAQVRKLGQGARVHGIPAIKLLSRWPVTCLETICRTLQRAGRVGRSRAGRGQGGRCRAGRADWCRAGTAEPGHSESTFGPQQWRYLKMC